MNKCIMARRASQGENEFMSDLVKRAEQFARKAHDGQFRRDGVTPYIMHVEKVVSLLKSSKWFYTDEMIAAAWLYDVVEDCDVPFSFIGMNFSFKVLDYVERLTRRKDESYEDFISRIKLCDSASQIKVADILANLSDNPTPKQVKKYSAALITLLFEKPAH